MGQHLWKVHRCFWVHQRGKDWAVSELLNTRMEIRQSLHWSQKPCQHSSETAVTSTAVSAASVSSAQDVTVTSSVVR